MPTQASQFCGNCGAGMAAGARFCGKCGAPAAAPPRVELPATAPQSATAMLAGDSPAPSAPPPAMPSQPAPPASAVPPVSPLSTASMPAVAAPSGDFIGPYRLLRELGRGGMGLVYLAMRDDGAFRKNVALKLMLRDQVTPEFVQRFRQERQVLAAMDHPNIARILDGGDTPDGMPYYVMEYVEGKPLDVYCEEQGLTIAARIRLFQQVCQAVDYLHENSILHRDLKPSNILVSNDGVVKLLDFGIAKIVGAGSLGAPDLTSAQGRPMTPAYASPEQIAGATLQKTSDIYSLGAILYRLLTGRNPFESIDEIMARLATKSQPAPPSQSIRADMKASQDIAHLRRAISGELDGIVMMALRFDPKQRYQTAGALARDLQRFLDGEDVTAYRASVADRSVKMLKRKWVVLAVAAGFIILAAFGVWQWRRGETQKAANAVLSEKLKALDRLNSTQQSSAPKTIPDQIADVQTLRNTFKDLPSVAARMPEKTPEVLNRGVSYLDRVSTRAAGNPDLGVEVARAYGDIGALQEAGVGGTGRVAALKTYQKAANLLVAAGNANPADARPRDLLVKVSSRIEILGGTPVSFPQAVAPQETTPVAPPSQVAQAQVTPPVRKPVVGRPPAAQATAPPSTPPAAPVAVAPPPAAPPAISQETEDRLSEVATKVEVTEQSIKPYRDNLERRGQALNPDLLSAMLRMRSSLETARRNAAAGNEAAAKENLSIAEGLSAKVLRAIGR